MQLTASLPYSWLAQRIEDYWPEMKKAVGDGIELKPQSAIDIQGLGSRLKVSQSLKVGIHPDRIGFRRAMGLQFGLPRLLTFTIRIHIEAKGEITPDWELNLATHASYEWEAKPSTLGLLPLPITEFLSPILTRELEALCIQLDNQLPSIVDLKAVIHDLQKDLAHPIKLEEGFELDLAINPIPAGSLVADKQQLNLLIETRPTAWVYPREQKSSAQQLNTTSSYPIRTFLSWEKLKALLDGTPFPFSLGMFTGEGMLNHVSFTKKGSHIQQSGKLVLSFSDSQTVNLSFTALWFVPPTLLNQQAYFYLDSFILQEAPGWLNFLARVGAGWLKRTVSSLVNTQIKNEVSWIRNEVEESLESLQLEDAHILHIPLHWPTEEVLRLEEGGILWESNWEIAAKLDLFSLPHISKDAAQNLS